MPPVLKLYGKPDSHELSENGLEISIYDREQKEIRDSSPFGNVSPDSQRETIVLIGTGELARGLLICLVRRGYKVVVGSRNPDKNRLRVERIGGEIANYQNALNEGKLVIVAIPLEGFETLPADLFKGKFVVDVSNRSMNYSRDGPSLALQLQKLLPGSKVVKAFNTLSAYGLQNNLFQGSKDIPVCSDYEDAKAEVMALVQNLRFTPVDRGSLSSATEIEDIPLAFFQEWRLAGKLSFVILIFVFFIQFFRSQLCPNFQRPIDKDWDWSLFARFPLVAIHASAGGTSISLLTACYLPGVIAAILQLWRGTKYSEFPKWLDIWLRSRKQIGLLAYAFGSMHTLMAIFDVIRRGMEEWRDFSYTAFGCFAIGLMTILAITSLPSVSDSLSWREFSFVQRFFGWWALAFAVVHLIFKKWHKLVTNVQKCVILPDVGQIVIILPLVTILLKLILILPCIDKPIQRIRRGYERNSGFLTHV